MSTLILEHQTAITDSHAKNFEEPGPPHARLPSCTSGTWSSCVAALRRHDGLSAPLTVTEARRLMESLPRRRGGGNGHVSTLCLGFFLHVISAMLVVCVAVLLASLALVLAQTDINLETLGQSVPLSFKTFDKNVLTVPLPWIIAYTSSPSEALEAAAREHEGLIRFGTVDPEAEATLLKFQGLEESNIPKFRVYPVGMAEEKEHFTVASVCLH